MSSSDMLSADTETRGPNEAVPTDGGQHQDRSAARRRRGRPDVTMHVVRALLLAGLIGIWHLADRLEWMPPLYSASPLETWQRFTEVVVEALFWTNLQITVQETLGGWVIGASAGIVTGMAAGRYERVGRILDPFLVFANAMPKIALAPFLILWFGVGQSSKVVLAAVIVYFIIFVPTQAAVATIDRDLDLVITTMAATELQKFTKVVLPGILPPVFGALRLGAVYSLLAVVTGEFIAAEAGLGQQLISSSNQFDMASAFVYLFVLSLLAVLINVLVGVLERRTMRWKTYGKGQAAVASP